jgi:Domain of unknown function (DUF4214)/RTX calcium-binding nonapeptide repeat (4 copies)
VADPRPWVYGTEGADVIATNGADLRFSALAGDDVMYGGPPTHWIYPHGSSPYPNPQLAYAARSAGILVGGDGNDTVYGTGGRDYLYGGDGNDLIVGGHGADYMSGGGGEDTFLFRPLSPSNPLPDTTGDWISDFQPGVDKLDLSAYGSSGAVWMGTERLTFGSFQVGYAPDVSGGVTVRFGGPLAGQLISGEFHVSTGYGGPQVLSKADFVIDWSGGSVSDDLAPSPSVPAPSPSPTPLHYAFVDEYQAQAARIYDTFFDRVPDREGLRFWHKALANGYDLHDIADSFMTSPEFQVTYAGTDNRGFVAKLYENVLDRAGEPGGLAFWSGNLDAGLASRADVVVGFSEAPEHAVKVQPGEWVLY